MSKWSASGRNLRVSSNLEIEKKKRPRYIIIPTALSAGAVEYTDYISAEV